MSSPSRPNGSGSAGGPPGGSGAFSVMGLLNRVNAQAPPSQPRRAAAMAETPELTIVDDGGPDVSQVPRRMSYNNAPTHHRDPLRQSRGTQLRLASGRPSAGSGHRNTADDILPHLVKEVFRVDIRQLGLNDYNTVYRIRMKDGTMRMMTSTLIDEHGLRHFVDEYWRTADSTPLRDGARAAGCI